MAKQKGLPSGIIISIDFESLLGAGGGMVWLSLFQHLAIDNPIKTLLIILAPPVTLALKYIFGICTPEITNYIKNFRVVRSKQNLVFHIDKMLKDPSSGKIKDILESKRESIQLSIIDDKLEHIESLKNPE